MFSRDSVPGRVSWLRGVLSNLDKGERERVLPTVGRLAKILRVSFEFMVGRVCLLLAQVLDFLDDMGLGRGGGSGAAKNGRAHV